MNEKNIGQKDVAKEIGIRRSRVNGWTKGYVKPLRRTIVKLSGFFGCDRNWLEDSEGEPFPEKKEKFSDNKTNIAPLVNRQLFNHLEGWLIERQGRIGADQFVWFQRVIEELHPDFTEYLKKRSENSSEDREDSLLSVEGGE